MPLVYFLLGAYCLTLTWHLRLSPIGSYCRRRPRPRWRTWGGECSSECWWTKRYNIGTRIVFRRWYRCRPGGPRSRGFPVDRLSDHCSHLVPTPPRPLVRRTRSRARRSSFSSPVGPERSLVIPPSRSPVSLSRSPASPSLRRSAVPQSYVSPPSCCAAPPFRSSAFSTISPQSAAPTSACAMWASYPLKPRKDS